MNFPDYRTLQRTARQRLNQAEHLSTITLIYGSITVGLTVLSLVVSYCLDLQIDKTGGLSSLGQRSILSSLQQLLSVLQMLAVWVMNLGFTGCILRICRERYTTANTLRVGVERFWPMLRSTLLRGVIYSAVSIGCFYASVMIYAFSPLSGGLSETIQSFVADGATQESLMGNPVVVAAVTQAFVPIACITIGLFLMFGLPIFYRYRLVDYIILDNPGKGARFALMLSRRMMQGNRFKLLKVDFCFWWYYVLSAIALLLGYGDVILSMIGIPLPFSADVGYFLFFAFYAVAQFAIIYFLKAKVDQAYALIYDSMLPKEQPQSNGVVLGNIFQM